MNETGACAYRTAVPGEACAIGVLLRAETDDDIDFLSDYNENSDAIVEEVLGQAPSYFPVSTSLLGHLQEAHDDPENWGVEGLVNWQLLHDIAAEYGISSEVVTQLGHHGI